LENRKQNKVIFSFSGHESFYCRNGWLKKGYELIKAGKNFNEENAVIELGVGKNMVASIRYWVKAFGLIDNEQKLTKIADLILDDNGYDPHIENIGTLWLLHYQLNISKTSSITSLFFNEFTNDNREFKKENLFVFLKRKCEEIDLAVSENTIITDISVFFRNYVRPEKDKNTIEDDFTSMLIDLNLITVKQGNTKTKDAIFIVNREEREEIAPELILFTILDNFENEISISFNDLMFSENSPGMVFSISQKFLYEKLIEICNLYPGIVYSDNAGVRQLQFKTARPDKWQVIDDYYKRNN